MTNVPTNGPDGPPAAPGWPDSNTVRHPIPTGGKLLRGSNGWMLNGLGGQPDLFSAGRAIRSKMGAVIETKLADVMTRRKKRTDDPSLLTPAIGVAAGLGAVGLGHGFLSDQDAAKFQRFSDVAKTWRTGENPRKAFREYADIGSEASTAKPFGASLAKTMEVGRKGISGAADKLLSMDIVPDAQKPDLDRLSRIMHWSPDSGKHYEEFARGPLLAYPKRVDEYINGQAHRTVNPVQLAPVAPAIEALRRNTPLPPSAISGQIDGTNSVPAAQKSFEDLRGQLANDGLTRAASDTPGYDKAATQLRAAITSYTASTYGKQPWELDSKTQSQALTRFDDWLKGSDKDLWAKKQVIDFSGGVHSAMGQTYSGAADKGLAARKWIIGGGLAVAGISAGVLLYNLMKKKREEKDQAERGQMVAKAASAIQTKLAVITCGGTTGPMKNMKQGPQFVDWTKSNPDYAVAVRDPADFAKEKDAMRRELAVKTAADISLRTQCTLLEKLAAKEPAVAEHSSAPEQQLRSRAEVIVRDADGQIWSIDKGDYILFPGGGIDDGEHPEHSAVREVLEELGHNIVNLHQGPVVESLWPDGHPLTKDTPFKGERAHFFTALDAGDAGMPHADIESFKTTHPQTLINRLQELMDDPKQAWAKANNKARLLMIGLAYSAGDAGAVPMKLAQAAPATPGVMPGVAPNPDQQFIAQLAAPLKQDNQGLPIKPATPGQSTTQLPPGVFHPTPNDIQSQATQTGLQTKTADDRLRQMCAQLEKTGQLLPGDEDSVDVSGGELTPGPVDFAQNVQGDVHGQPQATKLIQFAQSDPHIKATAAQQGPGIDDQLAGQQMKTADAAKLLPRKQYLMFTPDGKVIVRRLNDRRFTLPEQGEGRPAPYEQPVRLVPERGIPEAGYHGYELGLNVGAAKAIPQGFEALPSQDVLKDLYAGMGLAKNKAFIPVDRSRSRAILRYLKSTTKPAVPSVQTAAANSFLPEA